MNLKAHPDLLDRLAAGHALGTLRAGARRRFESLARGDAAVRARAIHWQETFAAMTEMQPAVVPDPNVWKRIAIELSAMRTAGVGNAASDATPPHSARLGAAGDAQTMTDGLLARLRRSLGRWRLGAAAGGLTAAAAVVAAVGLSQQVRDRDVALASVTQANTRLVAQLAATPDIQYVAVLADDKADASMLVTFDPTKSALVLKRIGDFKEQPDQSLQLWAIAPTGSPRSLGLVASRSVARLVAGEGEIGSANVLAVTLEKKGGVPAGAGPEGPVVFKGQLLKTTT